MYWGQNSQYSPITITDVVNRHKTFLCEFVDLKRNGWLHYSKALNTLTYGFWNPMLEESDKYIENLAEDMKKNIREK